MSRPSALSSADHTLIHAVGFLACAHWNERENFGLMLDLLGKVLPKVNREIPMLKEFARVADELLGARGDERAFTVRRQDAQGVVARWHASRAGAAWEIFKQGGKRDA